MNVAKYFLIILVVIAASVAAWYFYPRANMDYAAAQRENTIAAYQHFLDTYPKDGRRQVVLERIDQLTWDAAQKSGSLAEVDAYIHRFPNGKYTKEASDLKDKLEIANLPIFEGTTSALMGLGGFDSSGTLSLNAPAIELDTKSGRYQILTSDKTIYQGMKVSDAGVLWDLGKQFRVRGNLIPAPKGPHLGGVEFIDARVVEEIGK